MYNVYAIKASYIHYGGCCLGSYKRIYTGIFLADIPQKINQPDKLFPMYWMSRVFLEMYCTSVMKGGKQFDYRFELMLVIIRILYNYITIFV